MCPLCNSRVLCRFAHGGRSTGIYRVDQAFLGRLSASNSRKLPWATCREASRYGQLKSESGCNLKSGRKANNMPQTKATNRSTSDTSTPYVVWVCSKARKLMHKACSCVRALKRRRVPRPTELVRGDSEESSSSSVCALSLGMRSVVKGDLGVSSTVERS